MIDSGWQAAAALALWSRRQRRTRIAQQVNEPHQTLAGVKSGSSACLQGKRRARAREQNPEEEPMVTLRFGCVRARRSGVMRDTRVKYTRNGTESGRDLHVSRISVLC